MAVRGRTLLRMDSTTKPRRRHAALAGAVAALFALGVSELLTGLIESVPSLVVAIGTGVIDLAPPALKDWAIETLGTADKPALIIGIVVLATLFGAGLGLLAVRTNVIPAVGFLVFGALGAVAAARDPQAGVLASSLVAAVAAAAGIVALLVLVRRLPIVEPAQEGADIARRSFLRGAGAFTVLAGLAAVSGRFLLDRMKLATSRAEVVLPTAEAPLPAPSAAASLNVAGVSPVVTPNGDFYRIDTALSVPNVDLDTWVLKVSGMVDRPLELTYNDLLDMPMVERYVTLSCVSNNVGGGLVGNAKWLGVPLIDVLNEAGVQEGAGQIVGRSVDGFTVGFPTEAAFDGREAMIAVGMNDDPLPFDHGFPARLVVAGLYGYVSATKWLGEIELTTWDAFDAYWIPRGWAKEAPIKTQSRIDTPRQSSVVSGGRVPIAGVAWAPGRGISKVEVQIEDGDWQPAQISEALSDESWVQWAYDWEATPGRYTLRVRATDGRGDTQPANRVPARPDGATGYHTIPVSVE